MDLKGKRFFTQDAACLFMALLLPFLRFHDANKEILLRFFDIYTVFSMLVVLVSAAYMVLIWMPLKAGWKDRISSLLPASILLFFSYGMFYDLFDSMGFLAKIRLIPTYMAASFFILFILWRFVSPNALRVFYKYFLIASLVMPVWSLGGYFFFGKVRAPSTQNQSKEVSFSKRPNVYFILVDGYGRQDVFMNELSYDNQSFLDGLRSKGFFIAKDSFSNYHFTLASLGATFSMDYHSKTEALREEDLYETVLGNNLVVQQFKRNGYHFVLGAPGAWGDWSSNRQDMSIDAETVQGSLKTIGRSILQLTPLSGLSTYIKRSYLTLEDVKLSYGKMPSPRFVYVHLAQVHDGVLDESCKATLEPTYAIVDEESSNTYVRCVKCINQELEDFVGFLQNNDPQGIIIIQGDHGPGISKEQNNSASDRDWGGWSESVFKNKNAVHNRFAILNALYIPEFQKKPLLRKKYLYENISPVNTFRMLFSYLSQKDPNYLADTRNLVLRTRDKEYHCKKEV